MSPSIFQLQALGMQDVYLTQDPQINIFKYNYYRYVNFATDTAKLNFNTSVNFTQKSSCVIPKRGHLLSKLHLHISLPILEKTSGKYACWSDTLGYGIFDGPIELQIGGVVVDRLYPQFLDAWDELTNNNDLGKNFMILKSDTFVSNFQNASKVVNLVIPLEFWFTKKYNMALPLLSIFDQDIKVVFKLRSFSECINYDGLTPPNEVDIIRSELYAEYIFLDDVILKQFQFQKHQFLIEQVQYNGDEMIQSLTNNYNSDLKFNYPCKELVFFSVDTNNLNTNNYFSYSNSLDETPLIQEASLLLDGKYRFDKLPEFYYRTIFPDNVHSVIPMKYIYVMPFCLRPEDNQPTGSLNMSMFNDITLALKLSNNNPSVKLYVFAISYNIVTIENGVLNLEFVYV